jgi:membrane protein required for colicin V production
MSLAGADLLFSALVLVLVVRGAIRGFVAEALSMAAILAAVASALLFMNPVASMIEARFGPSIWSRVGAALALFVLTYLLVKVVEGLLHRLLESLRLDRLDRALGVILGGLEGLLVVSALIVILTVQPFFDARDILDGSIYVRLLGPVLGSASGSLGLPTSES